MMIMMLPIDGLLYMQLNSRLFYVNELLQYDSNISKLIGFFLFQQTF
jgi:hypothetical protein